MLSAISPGRPLHPHLSLTDGGDDVQSDVALLRARGWTDDPAVRSFFSGRLREIWTIINDAPVQLTLTRLLFFSPPGPCDVPSLSPAPGVDFHCKSGVFLSDRKCCAQPNCCGGAAFNTQNNPAGNSSTKQFLEKGKRKKKRDVSLSSKTPRKVCAHHVAASTLSFCVLSTFMSFLFVSPSSFSPS